MVMSKTIKPIPKHIISKLVGYEIPLYCYINMSNEIGEAFNLNEIYALSPKGTVRCKELVSAIQGLLEKELITTTSKGFILRHSTNLDHKCVDNVYVQC